MLFLRVDTYPFSKLGGGTNFPLLDVVRIDRIIHTLFTCIAMRRWMLQDFRLSHTLLFVGKPFIFPYSNPTNQTIAPRRGRALVWPSVQDPHPNAKDPRTDHQALPVIRGIKYGANAWVHLRDFKTPHAVNCI
jgi:hypothetical protein